MESTVAKGENAGNLQCFLLYHKEKYIILATFNLSSANAFNLVMSKNLSFSKGLIAHQRRWNGCVLAFPAFHQAFVDELQRLQHLSPKLALETLPLAMTALNLTLLPCQQHTHRLKIIHCILFNSLSHNKILDWSKFKAFADDKINVNEQLKFGLERVENVVGKRETAGYHFLLFQQCFQRFLSYGL